MQRKLDRISAKHFDLVVVGGGILGAFVALDASTRGFDVALIERDDFGCGTTAACGKVLHGGLRYLKQGRLPMALEANREQAVLRRLVPELVRPLPFVVPVLDGGARERMILRAGAMVWQAFMTLSRGADDLPPPRYLDEAEACGLDPRIERVGATGALVFQDYQVRSPERLTLAVVQAAAEAGAAVANHLDAVDLRVAGAQCEGVAVRDRLGGAEFTVRANIVVNAAGPWAPALWRSAPADGPPVAAAKGMHLVTDLPATTCAFALPWDPHADGAAGGSGRRVFVMPWEGRTLIGATYEAYEGSPTDCRPSAEDVDAFVREFSRRWPELGLESTHVRYAYAGLYPVFGRERPARAGFDASLHPLVVDHERTGGPSGILSVISTKLTTARALAERVTDTVCARSGRTRPCRTHSMEPLMFAGMDRGPTPVESEAGSTPADTAFGFGWRDRLTTAINDEMAGTLADFVMRRTSAGQRGQPHSAALREVARSMAALLDWTDARVASEVAAVETYYSAVELHPEGSVRVETPQKAVVS